MTKLISFRNSCHKIFKDYFVSPSGDSLEDDGEVSVPEEGAGLDVQEADQVLDLDVAFLVAVNAGTC